MAAAIPILVIAGTGSNVGKTSVTLGIVRNLVRAGLRVQPFKVGPDFLDPTWLSIASGRACYNLDGWMTSRAYVEELFARTTQDCDIAIIEGVMGMFDGAQPDSIEGSSAEIAMWLCAPVLLVTNCAGTAGSIAPMVKGFADFHPACQVAGVIANHCGSEGHANLLADALRAADLPPLVGWLQKESLSALPSRHLGLHPAHCETSPEDMISQLADAMRDSIRPEAVREIAADAQVSASITDAPPEVPTVRIGLARDEAFHFYYPDNLELLRRAGAELVEFSPIHDAQLPAVDALYLGGGYPELFAEKLAANETMRAAIRQFAEADNAIYAECGGLMYLSQAIRQTDGTILPMAGVLPFETEMLTRLRMLGYTATELRHDTLLGPCGMLVRGHEFHYSQIIETDNDDAWQVAYAVTGRRNSRPGGFVKGRILASYIHQHFGSNSEVAPAFVRNARRHG